MVFFAHSLVLNVNSLFFLDFVRLIFLGLVCVWLAVGLSSRQLGKV